MRSTNSSYASNSFYSRFYRQEDDSDEELVFNSDDEYDSDVAQDSLGKMRLYDQQSSVLIPITFLRAERRIRR